MEQQQQALPEGSTRQKGHNAQAMNIHIATQISELLRTTLGPKGMDKMLIDNHGDVVVTNDGVTILREMGIQQPAAKMMTNIARTQEVEVGDGTTTAVVIAGELLKKANSLIAKKIHPTIIARGYQTACDMCLEFLEDIKIPSDDDTLKLVAMTAMTGKSSDSHKEHLSNIICDAVKSVIKDGIPQIQDIKIEVKEGGKISDTILVNGVILDKQRLHQNMPTEVGNAKIALLDCALDLPSTEMDARINLTNPEQLEAFQNHETTQIKKMIDKIKAAGANVVFTYKGISDLAQHFLANEGIFAVRNIPKEDKELIAKATGARICDVEDLTSKHLGKAGLVEEKEVGASTMVFISNCKDPRSVSILVKGSTEQVVDEIKRALDDAAGVVANTVKEKAVVAGAGAPEAYLSHKLSEAARGLPGREQLAVKAFSEALEVIPQTLADNAGHDSIDLMTELRALHSKGKYTMGVDVFNGGVMDALEQDVLEPLKVKTQALNSAAEVAIMVLRIDDVIAMTPGSGRTE